ncbi:hypothetical protein [Kutzneria buriramensis]|uniref:hypothetical protein n=1 Tax=Kutzneria buriramensis TaxID=1045776 RepID=UPI00319DE1AD
MAIAWVAARGEDIVPLVGSRTRERLAEALPAMELNLTAGDLAEVEEAVPLGAARRPVPDRIHVQSRRGELSPVLRASRTPGEARPRGTSRRSLVKAVE